MASSSQQPTDCTSQSQMSIDPTVDAESPSSDVLNFDCIFRATYPNKGQFGPSGKRRTKGTVVYECLLCSSDQAWSNPKRDNAIYHAKRKHGDIVNSSDNTILERSSDMGPPLKQARLDNYYTATPSESALRKVFNSQRYTESMVGLLTRRRLPFSAVTWDEMQDVMLASKLKQDHNINWDPKRHRIRCILHVINLSLQAFLFASSREALQAALDAASDITGDELYELFNSILNDASGDDTPNQPDQMGAQTRHPGGVASKKASIQKENPPSRSGNRSDSATRRKGWILMPALRKLHRIGLWLRNSSIHSDAWDERIKLRLGIDNDTRWNSWYRMIDNLIRKKQQVKQFLLDYDKDLGDNILTSTDWDYLEKTHAFLQPFTSTTLWAQGVTATLSQNLMIMDILLRHYEQKKELYEAEETRDPLMLHSIDMGWFVLDKYYALSGESPIYATALLLDPSKRARYLKVHWKEEWAATAIRDGRTIWEEEYKMAPALGPAQALSEASRSQQGQPNELDRLLNEIMVAEDITRDVDDFENFIHAQPIKIEGSPLVWWCQRDQVRTYPRLSRMAIDILSVPPGSADPESAFSGGRRTLSWDRERMSCVNLEKVECIGNWLREGLIIPSSRGGRGLVVDGEINGSIWVDSDDYLD
ncbi:Zinc finger BED domain-containing protein DAYSLEEPER [Fusarium oxysporum f. sp. raphani]|uniref:Zinc finger BED domain-containing protein DAYSLEEPER n=1 Tax=Fusarium oxysporum f. sp. raphani TaxID=96318 RepID=A0A8J5NN86_FUSOX|nr:Zinc finger BED domain-containing protein DAYSLEEPER [Fusarium oxysporum f. sp. raphani]KAG7407948.1 Zinc finger BED domain-containing protein DAYSLEEPER [Fusarium oxysporum f. sp. raphani]KAG7407952.1 Zinc finger BED domain-containing protein DAYSLEEPER [Fusarium oxysporum f. sp. raphani]